MPIVNGNFGNPRLSSGQLTQGTIPGWTGSPGSFAPNYYFGVSAQPVIPTVAGPNFAYINNYAGATGPSDHSISQTLTSTFKASITYDLSAYIGWRGDNMESTGELLLWVRGTAMDGTVIGGTLLEEQSIILTQGQFVQGTLTYHVGARNPFVGENISVELMATPVGNNFAQTDFQAVSLEVQTAAAPEPAQWISGGILAGMGGLGFALRRLR